MSGRGIRNKRTSGIRRWGNGVPRARQPAAAVTIAALLLLLIATSTPSAATLDDAAHGYRVTTPGTWVGVSFTRLQKTLRMKLVETAAPENSCEIRVSDMTQDADLAQHVDKTASRETNMQALFAHVFVLTLSGHFDGTFVTSARKDMSGRQAMVMKFDSSDEGVPRFRYLAHTATGNHHWMEIACVSPDGVAFDQTFDTVLSWISFADAAPPVPAPETTDSPPSPEEVRVACEELRANCGGRLCAKLDDGTTIFSSSDGAFWYFDDGALAPREVWRDWSVCYR